jgi:hypothetical protein
VDGNHSDVGREFVRCLAAKDADALATLLSPKIDFRGITPSNEWRATTHAGVLEILFGSWFEPQDHVREILEVRTEPIADRLHLAYRLRVESEGETYLVEQQAYFDAEDGRIARMSMLCSGFRPIGEAPGA